MIDSKDALTIFDDVLSWKLRPRLDMDRFFDELGNRIHQLPAFQHLTLAQIDLLLAGLRTAYVDDAHGLEWIIFCAARDALGEGE
jgi:hypothetical protein